MKFKKTHKGIYDMYEGDLKLGRVIKSVAFGWYWSVGNWNGHVSTRAAAVNKVLEHQKFNPARG